MTEKQLRRFKLLRRFIHWLLAAAVVVYVVSGFGITEWQTLEPWTLGVVNKVNSMKIHNNFEWPFTALLVLHIFISLVYRSKKKSVQQEAGPGQDD
jgi:cytochrome b subunit of formate dehydrogenase